MFILWTKIQEVTVCVVGIGYAIIQVGITEREIPRVELIIKNVDWFVDELSAVVYLGKVLWQLRND